MVTMNANRGRLPADIRKWYAANFRRQRQFNVQVILGIYCHLPFDWSKVDSVIQYLQNDQADMVKTSREIEEALASHPELWDERECKHLAKACMQQVKKTAGIIQRLRYGKRIRGIK